MAPITTTSPIANSNSGGGSDLPADVITYIGVPLAVLGVVPTLYTCLKSLLTLRQIRKLLRDNQVSALTRSSLLSGIIEVEMPRKSLAPLDRNDQAYFRLGDRVSELKGGSWTQLNWKEMSIGVKNLRVQYHDELSQPQAEIDFEGLVAFLLDLGAVPDALGWEDLRSSGLWTPAGTRLMRAPHCDESVLYVTTSEDSDGILSLGLFWRADWGMRSINDLPPYWMRLTAPLGVEIDAAEEANGQKNEESIEKVEGLPRADTEETLHEDGNQADDSKNNRLSVPVPQDGHSAHKRSFSKTSAHTSLSERTTTRSVSMISFSPHLSSSIRIRLGIAGLLEACYEDLPSKKIKLPHLMQTPHGGPNNTATWFASAATALGSSNSSLWSYTVPASIVSLSQRESVPSGILVLLDLIEESSVPAFRQPFDDKLAEHEQWVRQEKIMKRQMENLHMTPEERSKAFFKQVREDDFERREMLRRREVEAEAKRERDLRDALSSQRVGVFMVAEAGRKFLVQASKKQEEMPIKVDEDTAVVDIVSLLLWEMVKSAPFAYNLSRMLDMWKEWAEGGGMTRTHYEAIMKDKAYFAYAACMMYIVCEAAGSESGSVVTDLQECLRIWRKVRLG